MELETLLIEAREPEPTDDGFTDRVMASVRTDRATWWRRRRFLTRPMALAAAAVLVTGGALAAVQTVTDGPPEAPIQTNQATAGGEGAPTQQSEELVAPAAPQQAAQRSADGPVSHREGSTEWGYDTEHTAYVVDHATGLRLGTETYTNTFISGQPQRVTLTLTNTTGHPVGIASRTDCALAVAAFPDRNAAAVANPDDGSWHCAEGVPGKLVLAPGESLSADAELALAEAGEWAVVGMCRCTVANTGEADRDGVAPPIEIPDLNLGSLVTPELDDLDLGVDTRLTDPTGSSSTTTRMVTPPIRVTVSG